MFTIGTVLIDNPFLLAPLAGYTDLAFRTLCREYGAGLCVSEMISCHGLVYQQKKTLDMLQSCEAERPRSFQLFGADAAIMGEAAALLNTYQPDIIDINMGCPVKKVTKRGAGAALMANLPQAEQIICSVMKRTTAQVTVKIRSGPDSRTLNGLELARIAECNGISAVTVHGRTWKQGFSGNADWNYIAAVKKALAIPVIGNGDIATHEQAVSRLESSGCDGVMIGRASLGNPWVFQPDGKPPEPTKILTAVNRHISLIEQFTQTPEIKLAPIKNHLGKYFRGFAGSSTIRRKVYEATTWEALKNLLSDIQ